jgi:hypothetical protein
MSSIKQQPQVSNFDKIKFEKKVSAEVAVFLGVDWRWDETVGYCEESTVIHI